jgi:hypothetical protein
MARNRQPIRALTKSAAEIAADAQVERDRKAASKAALRAARKQAESTESETPALDPTPAVDHSAEDHANALATARADAEAVGVTFEAMCADMGIDPATGAPAHVPGTAKPRYTGPMLALRSASKSYVKGANGNPHTTDNLAFKLEALDRLTVVRVLMLAMQLEGNPYLHLNAGQQSMNLRNKARGMFKNGTLTMAEVDSAIAAVTMK